VAAAASAGQQERVRCGVLALLARARPWLAPAAVVLSLGAVLPPSATYARQYEAAQALQFVIFAVVAPALLALSRPRPGGPASGRGHQGSRDLTRRRGRRPAARRPTERAAAARLLAFIALVIIWRLPAVLNALAADPALAAAELVTLTGAGSGVWLELAGPALLRQPLARPLRAAVAAAAMWTMWIIAYVTGMSHLSWTGTHRGTPGALSAAADQQVTVGIMWAVPAICFLPVIYGMLITWLGEREDPGQQHAVPPPAAAQPGLSSAPPRPPRGWRSPSP
jgi:cytochrome c oxidase assembly factor CtaG